MSTISLHHFKELLNDLPEDEILIDVRSAGEFLGSSITGAKNIPLPDLHKHQSTLKQYNKVYCICASGNRSGQAQRALTELGITSVSVDGGMTMWEQQKLPVTSSRKTIPIIRQVLMVAGSLVLLGTVLAFSVSTNWLLLTGFVGGGLLFAGLTGICTMSYILEQMPWNKVANPTASTGGSCCMIDCTPQASAKEDEWKQDTYTVKQFTNTDLAHYSYAIVSGTQMALVDPARDPEPYLEYAKQQGATITAIFETHPHADFISGHKEIAKLTGATIYVNSLVGAEYEHTGFGEGDSMNLGNVTLKGMSTPGHSPDSISVLLEQDGTPKELFSGDTLFVGDVGRPDLRESAGNITAKREELAGMMYETVETKLKTLPDGVRVFPAHGAGSLCGKALGQDPYTTIGKERSHNPAFKKQTKAEFVARLTDGQPFIPKYFVHDVSVNKQGAEGMQKSLEHITTANTLPNNTLVIDTRSQEAFAAGHTAGAINIPNSQSFSTWLGSIVAPNEAFVLIVNKEEQAEVLERVANIGYEAQLTAISTSTESLETLPTVPQTIKPTEYTIVDVRSINEANEHAPFADSIHIPLQELRERANEVPSNKPILVHCAGGYRSAIGSSILALSHQNVYDLSERIKDYN